MCDFADDLKSRMVHGMTAAGVTVETASMVAAEILHGFMRDRAGERVLIAKSGASRIEKSQRDRAIIRDFKRGERVPLLARRYSLTRVRIWQIIKGE